MSEHRDGVTICEHGHTLDEDCPICDRLFVEADASESSTPTVPAQGGEDEDDDTLLDNVLFGSQQSDIMEYAQEALRARLRALRSHLTAILPQLEAAKADSARLDDIEWFGCMTGDCPHWNQAECDVAILGVVRSVIVERQSARHLASEQQSTTPNEQAPVAQEPTP